MNDPRIPSYPVVHVTVHPDGSAHVNAAGDHRNYPAGDIQDTRAQVTAYAIAVAARLGRGVRMTTTDPDGEWKLGVYPDGEVVDLAPAPVKGRPAPKTGIAQRRPGLLTATKPEQATGSTTALIEQLAEPATALPRDASAHLPVAGTRVALLKFSTGDTAMIGPRNRRAEPRLSGSRPGRIPACGRLRSQPHRVRARTPTSVGARRSPSAIEAPATARPSLAHLKDGSSSRPVSHTNCSTATCCTLAPMSPARLQSPRDRSEGNDDATFASGYLELATESTG